MPVACAPSRTAEPRPETHRTTASDICGRQTGCQGGKKIALRGGDGTEAHLPNPPLPLLGRRARRGVWAGAALPAVLGGGGSDPNIHGSK